MAGKRANNKPWKHIYGVDRKYTRRVDAAKAREVRRIAAYIVRTSSDVLDALGDL